MGRRRRARSHGGAELLRRRGRACPQRERRRRLLRAKTEAAGAPARRRGRGARRAGDRRIGGVECDCARAFHHRADHRLRPAARADLLSDGRRHALHDNFRVCPILSPQAVGYCVRPRVCACVGRHGLRLALGRGGRRALGSADVRRVRWLPGGRGADRFCAGVHRAHLHLDRRHAARPDFRAANGARHRQFRPARDSLLHPRRLPDGGERDVRPSDRAARTPRRARSRRAQRGDGAVDGDLLRHFRFEDGRCRGGGLGAHPGGSAVSAEPRRRGRLAGGFRGHG